MKRILMHLIAYAYVGFLLASLILEATTSYALPQWVWVTDAVLIGLLVMSLGAIVVTVRRVRNTPQQATRQAIPFRQPPESGPARSPFIMPSKAGNSQREDDCLPCQQKRNGRAARRRRSP